MELTRTLSNGELTTRLERLENTFTTSIADMGTKIDAVNTSISAFDDRLKRQEDMTDTLGFGYHSRELNKLKAAYLSRIHNDIFNSAICGDDFKAGNYSLAWKPFFMKWITHDICSPFEVNKIGNIKTENFEDAMVIAKTWKPSTHKIKEALERIKKIHYITPYPTDRWSAFRHYMADTHDGELNPWA